MTELPCNAIEFEFGGGIVSYPANVCIGSDDTSSQSKLFYCEDDVLKFKTWDSSSICQGKPDTNGTSFEGYINQQGVGTQSQFGEYTVECGKDMCDYIVVKGMIVIYSYKLHNF